jgi:hypothetical protein
MHHRCVSRATWPMSQTSTSSAQAPGNEIYDACLVALGLSYLTTYKERSWWIAAHSFLFNEKSMLTLHFGEIEESILPVRGSSLQVGSLLILAFFASAGSQGVLG